MIFRFSVDDVQRLALYLQGKFQGQQLPRQNGVKFQPALAQTHPQQTGHQLMQIDTRAAGIQPPSALYTNFTGEKLAALPVVDPAVGKIAVRAAEIQVALAGQGIGYCFGQADRVHLKQSLPGVVAQPHFAQRLDIADMGVGVLQTDLPPHIGGLLGPAEQAAFTAAVPRGVIHQPHAVGTVQFLLDQSKAAVGQGGGADARDDAPGHGQQAQMDAGVLIQRVEHGSKAAVGQAIDKAGDYPVNHQVFQKGAADALGHLTAAVGSLLRQHPGKAIQYLKGQRLGPAAYKAFLQLAAAGLQSVVPVAARIGEQSSAGQKPGLNGIQRPHNVLLQRQAGLPVGKGDALVQNFRVAGGVQIVGQAFQRPEHHVAVAAVHLVGVTVEHEPLGPFSAALVLMAEDGEQNVTNQGILPKGHEKLKGPLAHVPGAPGRAAGLLQSVGSGIMHQGVVRVPVEGFVQNLQTAVLLFFKGELPQQCAIAAQIFLFLPLEIRLGGAGLGLLYIQLAVDAH